MKYLSKKLQELISGLKIRRQLNIIYLLGFFIPMACIGTFLVFNTQRLLLNYHEDLNEANNFRVKTIMLEITNQMYTLSENIVFDDELQDLLSSKYANMLEFKDEAAKYEGLENYIDNYSEIDSITVYSDNPTISTYRQIKKVDEADANSNWYKKAINQSSVFWTTISHDDEYGNTYYNLCLVRQIQLDENSKAVLLIKVDENYIKSQLHIKDYELLLYVDNGGIFFSSNRLGYERSKMIYIDYSQNFYTYSGQIIIQDKKYMMIVTTQELSKTDNRIYVCNMDNTAFDNIYQIVSLCLLIVVTATVIPFLLIRYFTIHFSRRVDTLREAMHKASNENYDVPAKLMGDDEISQAFSDLQVMVTKIKDKDAKMYEARINSQRLQNAQQRIEMDVLASQINPHFLYNTLETIRMKAFKAGDKDVATAIKLLGKSMRYVLENTGTSSTTLKNELEYIETYLQIQKLRFADKADYMIMIEEGLNTDEIEILPLLIQPIVENAIVHGLEDTEDSGQIRIEVYTRKKDILYIDISDNGCGMTPKVLDSLRRKIDTPHLNPSRNIGLYNINQRIRLCYGAEYGIMIDSATDRGTKVSLALPLKINMEEI
jgi:two-component system, sensor histidine kinase YesM